MPHRWKKPFACACVLWEALLQAQTGPKQGKKNFHLLFWEQMGNRSTLRLLRHAGFCLSLQREQQQCPFHFVQLKEEAALVLGCGDGLCFSTLSCDINGTWQESPRWALESLDLSPIVSLGGSRCCTGLCCSSLPVVCLCPAD